MIKDIDELNKKFDGYQFRDQQGHDLVNCVDFIELIKDAETLAKARAVLEKHPNAKFNASNLLRDIEAQKELYIVEVMKVCEALESLADALEGGGDD